MKSIKEKAEENCIKYGNLGNVAYQEFEAGANYVLEQIKNILSHPLKYVHSNKSVEERMIADIANIIEQLKK